MSTASWAALIAAAALGGYTTASADVIMYGGLGNFDTPNNSGNECNEFDIELEGPHCDDIYHTYTNYNYHAPKITALPNNIGVRIVYSNPTHATQPNAIEHFGVSIRGGVQITAQRMQWIPGTVGVPNPPPPPPPPPPLPIPIVTSEVLYLPTGIVQRETVHNVDQYGRSIWVKRSETRADRVVQLEELMPNDPLIAGVTPIDIELERLAPGEIMIEDEDANSLAELSSHVMVYEIYTDVGGAPGVLLTTVLTASITQNAGCPQQYMPYFTLQPVDVWAPPGEQMIYFTVAADGPDPNSYGNIAYQWQHEGADLIGEDQPFIKLDIVNNATAGTYTCIISNGCGFVMSDTAYLRIGLPPCTGDLNGDGEVDLTDLATLLAHYGRQTGASPADGDSDFDHDVDLSDLASLLSNYGSNCP